MGYNKANYSKIKQQFSDKRIGAINLSKRRNNEIHALLPGIAAIDAEISSFGMEILAIAQQYKGEEFEKKVNELSEKTKSLREKRMKMLSDAGYPADYDDEHFECPICSDTGYDGINMCRCMKKALTLAGFESAGIANLAEKDTFESYDISYHSENPDAYRNNGLVLAYLKNYSEKFTVNSKSILLMGGTGLGKTHLSVATAKAVIEKGFDVVFATASDLIGDFEYNQFRRNASDTEDKTAKYFSCDLLIIDDLGTEFSNSFTVSVIYNIINSRMNSRLPVMITTNMTPEKLSSEYDDRIYSRLIGEYQILALSGNDVRRKLCNKK